VDETAFILPPPPYNKEEEAPPEEQLQPLPNPQEEELQRRLKAAKAAQTTLETELAACKLETEASTRQCIELQTALLTEANLDFTRGATVKGANKRELEAEILRLVLLLRKRGLPIESIRQRMLSSPHKGVLRGQFASGTRGSEAPEPDVFVAPVWFFSDETKIRMAHGARHVRRIWIRLVDGVVVDVLKRWQKDARESRIEADAVKNNQAWEEALQERSREFTAEFDAFIEDQQHEAELEQGLARERGQEVGLKQLRQVLWRLFRGQVGMRVDMWRVAVKAAVYESHREIQRSMELQMKAQGRDAGLRMLRMCFYLTVKGEAASRLDVWRTAVDDEARAMELKQLRRELEVGWRDTTRGASLRLLRQVMAQLLRGEVALTLQVWRSAMQSEAEGLARAIQAHFQLQSKTQSQASGLRALRMVLKHRLQGEVGLRLEAWRWGPKDEAHTSSLTALRSSLNSKASNAAVRQFTQLAVRAIKGESAMRLHVWLANTQDAQSEAALCQMRATLELRAADAIRGAGYRRLEHTIRSIVKGDASMRIGVWRGHLLMHRERLNGTMKASLEAQMNAQRHDIGLRQLRQVLTKLAKGETALRMEVWRTATRDEARITARTHLETLLAQRMLHCTQGSGLRLLKRVAIKMIKGEAAMRIEIWRQRFRLERQAQARAKGHHIAQRILNRVLARLRKHEMGVRIELWRSAMHAERFRDLCDALEAESYENTAVKLTLRRKEQAGVEAEARIAQLESELAVSDQRINAVVQRAEDSVRQAGEAAIRKEQEIDKQQWELRDALDDALHENHALLVVSNATSEKLERCMKDYETSMEDILHRHAEEMSLQQIALVTVTEKAEAVEIELEDVRVAMTQLAADKEALSHSALKAKEYGIKIEKEIKTMEDHREISLEKQETELREASSAVQRQIALKMIKSIMTRRLQTVARSGLECWRRELVLQNSAQILDQRHAAASAALQASLEAKLHDSSQGAALRQFKQIVLRLVKGDVAVKLDSWRCTMQEEETAALIALQAALKVKMRTTGQLVSLQQLKQIMERIARGETAMRLEIWRQHGRLHATETQDHFHSQRHEAAKRKLQQVRQEAGLRELKLILTYLIKGELGWKLAVWRSKRQHETSSLLLASVHAAAQARDASLTSELASLREEILAIEDDASDVQSMAFRAIVQSKDTALRGLQRIWVGRALGEMGVLVKRWQVHVELRMRILSLRPGGQWERSETVTLRVEKPNPARAQTPPAARSPQGGKPGVIRPRTRSASPAPRTGRHDKIDLAIEQQHHKVHGPRVDKGKHRIAAMREKYLHVSKPVGDSLPGAADDSDTDCSL